MAIPLTNFTFSQKCSYSISSHILLKLNIKFVAANSEGEKFYKVSNSEKHVSGSEYKFKAGFGRIFFSIDNINFRF